MPLPRPLPAPVPVDLTKSTTPAKPIPGARPVRRAVPAESTGPRRATGRVPQSARSPRPKRTAAELLEEARAATADWPIGDLTAEGIRRTVRTSPARARVLRETLRAERAAEGGGPAEAVA